MKLNELLQLYAKHPQVKVLGGLLQEGKTSPVYLKGMKASAAPMIFSSLASDEVYKAQCEKGKGNPGVGLCKSKNRKADASSLKGTFLFLLDDEDSAGYFYHDLVQMLGEKQVLLFPSTYRRAVKYAQRDAANEVLRTDVLGRLSTFDANNNEWLFVVTYPAALAEKVASREEIVDHTITLRIGESYDLIELAKRLDEIGFVRRDYVYEPGEFAIRGSLLDVFSYSSEYPYRIDFFGDEIESLRTFEVQSQLSKEKVDEVSIVPDVDVQSQNLVSFTEFLPSSTRIVANDFVYFCDAVSKIYDEGFSHQAVVEKQAQVGKDAGALAEQLDKQQLLVEGEQLLRDLSPLQRIEIGPHPTGVSAAVLQFNLSPQPLFHKNFELLHESLTDLRRNRYGIYILADSQKQNERLRDIFNEMKPSPEADDIFIPVEHTLHEGFADDDLRLCFFTDHQIFDRFHKYSLRSDRARNTKMALSLKELMQFEPGDFVVHVDHGVGRFAGLMRMPGSDGEMQEVIKITFQNDDVVFVSIHALHKVAKYKGKDGEPPRLSRLGTGAWEKMKERTKKKIKDIARDLIQLYSRRREEKGFAFSHDSFLQHELEAGFAYEDTPDQLKVTREVKEDMERERPMDRLVCGDVGFGKTEIAIRAAMKAAVDNKQVAVLVPTTVLALQHYKTFASRLADFPVRVDYLSRARTATQTREVLKDLAEGKINVIVGTHKLIGKNIKFKDLGLLIIDEEQKFGVAVKEKLRQMKVNVDTLTMSATPIPRTLQFSLMGARDFSVIQTPPPNRHPIQTEIHTFHHDIIAEAVSFEMSRNGQVYIVTNRVSALGNLANLVREHVPDARVAIGHGQMPPAEMEQVILDFINHDFDVLISTTIVENGIDVPNANTIIIDAAHHFGLSDLHQMRGRVGRGNRKAFCYLLAPPLSLLKDDARRRLQAIENFSDLGSGIHIAMQDLDIRGAGNLLGAEQSGFIADLGYETYQKILAEAVSELKNEEFAEMYADELRKQNELSGELFVDDCAVDCDLNAYFPEVYVPGSAERMLLYRELDGLTTDMEIDAFRQRMHDRFGPLPPEGEELLRIVPLRRYARRAGAERLVLKQGRMTLHFVGHTDSPFYRSAAFDRIIQYATQNFRTCVLREDNGRRRMIIQGVNSVEGGLHILRTMLEG